MGNLIQPSFSNGFGRFASALLDGRREATESFGVGEARQDVVDRDVRRVRSTWIWPTRPSHPRRGGQPDVGNGSFTESRSG